METILTRSLPVLLLAALTVLAAGERPTSTSGPMTVQDPFNLKKTSYNFNTTLYWDYNKSYISPKFQVEYRYYKYNIWTIVETCANISHNYCDLSEKIIDPYVHYQIRVKAFVGSEMSKYAKTEFYLINDGIIGPPTLNASVDGKFINIDIWYPHVPNVNEKRNVGDYVTDLIYDISFGNEIEETEECDHFGCSISILITNNSKYCFSAQGISDTVPMTIKKSEEICISTTVTNGTSNKLYAIIFSILAVVFFLLALSLFILKKRIEAKSMLPLSLKSFAEVMTTKIYIPSDQVTKYDQVSASPVDSSEEKITPQEADKDLSVPDDSNDIERNNHGDKSSQEEMEQKAYEDQDREEESSNNHYYRTENSDSSIVCVTEDDVTKQEPFRDHKPVTNSFGYDKPHCIL
ncbi:interferon gamma receptor 1 [Rhinoderma darwinii]|uniref:interferon gamma receptor 1 n=1 Tax=Rhinoderma darwinii TaxID=43563 RepID=UPI003F66F015